jgi:uncharacterized protein YndB with AHSA1/START domain
MTPTTDVAALRLERTFDASAEDVFDAWTNPEVLRRWWGAGPDWSTPEVSVDLRVGGRYRLTMLDPASGEQHTVGGEYREISRPDRLVYTWVWEGTGPSAGHETVVTVTFTDDGGRTTAVLEHTGLVSAESASRHEHGWNACLDNLASRGLAA